MVERRIILGLVSAQAMCWMTSPAHAAKSKDPCRGKSFPAPPNGALAAQPTASLAIEGRYPDVGSTIAAIHLDFQTVIERNFSAMPRAGINDYVGSLNKHELDLLLQAYDAASLNSGRPAKLLDIISPALDVRQAQRVIQVQGFERLYSSILRVAPARAQITIDALHISNRLRLMEPRARLSANENPLDYTIKEIYLSYRTAPKGSFSVPAAMYETANFVGIRLGAAFGAGYSVGTVIQKTWESVSPSTWDKFSNFIGSSIDSFAGSVSSIIGMTPYGNISESMHFQVGNLQEELWNDFRDAGPRSWYAGGGDFGVTASWQIKDTPKDCK